MSEEPQQGSSVVNSDPGPAMDNYRLPSQPQTFRLDISGVAIVKVLLAFLAMKFLLAVWPVLILIFFALMVTAAFNSTVNKMQRRVNRTLCVLILLLGVALALAGLGMLLLPPLFAETRALIALAPANVRDLQHALMTHLHVNINLEEPAKLISEKLASSFPAFLMVMSSLGQAVAGMVVVIVLSAYLLIEGPTVGNGLASLLPRERRLGARRMVAAMGHQVGGYIRGQFLASALAGIYAGIVLVALHVPQPLALAALASVMDVVPMVGLPTATLAAGLMAFTVSPAKAVVVVVLYLLYHQMESNVIVPKIYGNTLGLSLSAIIISILVGVELLGVMGTVIALPVAAAIPSLVAYIKEWRNGDPVESPDCSD